MPILYSIVAILESLGDEYHRLAQHISDSKNGSNIIETVSSLNSLFKEYNKLFYSFDEKKAVELGENLETFKESVTEKQKKTNSEEKEMLYHIKKIRRTLVDLLQLAIELRLNEKINNMPILPQPSLTSPSLGQ